MDLRKSLRIALAIRDMNQADLARQLNTTPTQVSRWMNGRMKSETLEVISGALDMKVSEFVALGEPNKN